MCAHGMNRWDRSSYYRRNNREALGKFGDSKVDVGYGRADREQIDKAPMLTGMRCFNLVPWMICVFRQRKMRMNQQSTMAILVHVVDVKQRR
jgi:hypothetical protein